MPGEAVDEVVLAAVGLVGDHHDVAPVRQHRMAVALLLGEELLDGREHHAAGGDGELGAQVGPVLGLHRWLAQELAAAGEGAEQLVVEVVAVGEHHDGGVRHLGCEDHPAGVERHGQALARALGVPDHADAAVALGAARQRAGLVVAAFLGRARSVGGLGGGSAQRLLQRHVDGVELVVARHLLDELPAAQILEHDEVAHEIEEAALLEHALQHHLQLGHALRGPRRRWCARA